MGMGALSAFLVSVVLLASMVAPTLGQGFAKPKTCIDRSSQCALWVPKYCAPGYVYLRKPVSTYWCPKSCNTCKTKVPKPKKLKPPPKMRPPKKTPPPVVIDPLPPPTPIVIDPLPPRAKFVHPPPKKSAPAPPAKKTASPPPPKKTYSPPPPKKTLSPPPPKKTLSPPPPKKISSPPPPKKVETPKVDPIPTNSPPPPPPPSPPPPSQSPPSSPPLIPPPMPQQPPTLPPKPVIRAAAQSVHSINVARWPYFTVTPITPIESQVGIVSGYNGEPLWSRIDSAFAPDGTVYSAILGSTGIFVYKFPPGAANYDSFVKIDGGEEISGLVASNDGFAVLHRRDTDQGYLTVYQGQTLKWEKHLTGPTGDAFIVKDSCAVMDGMLAFNGKNYASYFRVQMIEGHWGDKLVYHDLDGNQLPYPNGWGWGCSHNEGIALAPLPQIPFASLCVDDWRSGIYVTTGIGAPAVAPMVSQESCWAGYCGANLGPDTLLQLPTGKFMVAFNTRGSTSAMPDGTGRGFNVTAKYVSHQVAISFLDETASKVLGDPVIIADDTSLDHVNVRIALYGGNYVVLSYETVQVVNCNSGTCQGAWQGTSMTLLSLQGEVLKGPVPVPVSVPGELATLDSGEVVWLFNDMKKDYSKVTYWQPQSALTSSSLKFVKLEL